MVILCGVLGRHNSAGWAEVSYFNVCVLQLLERPWKGTTMYVGNLTTVVGFLVAWQLQPVINSHMCAPVV